MDWKKERATRNLCGYCIGSPPSANCDGSCFNSVNIPPEETRKNRLFHVQAMLRALPGKRQALIDREDELRKELSALMTETIAAQPSMNAITITDTHAEMDHVTFNGVMLRPEPMIMKEGLMWKTRLGETWHFTWITLQGGFLVMNSREVKFKP